MFLRRLAIAIGRVLGITQDAGPVSQEADSQTGGLDSTAKEQHKPASQELKAKRSRVKAVITAPSPKIETLPVPTRTKKSSAAGTQSAPPARQPAQSKPNSKRLRAVKDIQDLLHNREVLAAQVEAGVRGQQPQIAAKPSRQGRKPKSLVVKSTTAVKLSSKEHTATKPKRTVPGKPAKTPARKIRQHVK